MSSDLRSRLVELLRKWAREPQDDLNIFLLAESLVLHIAFALHEQQSRPRYGGEKLAAEALSTLATLLDGLKRHIDEMPLDALEAFEQVREFNDAESKAIPGKLDKLPPAEIEQIEEDVLAVVFDTYASVFDTYAMAPITDDHLALRDPALLVAVRRIPSIEELSKTALPRLILAAQTAQRIVHIDPGIADPPNVKPNVGRITQAAAGAYEFLTRASVNRGTKPRRIRGKVIEPFSDFLKGIFIAAKIDAGVDYQIRCLMEERQRRAEDA